MKQEILSTTKENKKKLIQCDEKRETKPLKMIE